MAPATRSLHLAIGCGTGLKGAAGSSSQACAAGTSCQPHSFVAGRSAFWPHRWALSYHRLSVVLPCPRDALPLGTRPFAVRRKVYLAEGTARSAQEGSIVTLAANSRYWLMAPPLDPTDDPMLRQTHPPRRSQRRRGPYIYAWSALDQPISLLAPYRYSGAAATLISASPQPLYRLAALHSFLVSYPDACLHAPSTAILEAACPAPARCTVDARVLHLARPGPSRLRSAPSGKPPPSKAGERCTTQHPIAPPLLRLQAQRRA
jgi:hypothetical protein